MKTTLSAVVATLVLCAALKTHADTLQNVYNEALINDAQFRAAQAIYEAGLEDKNLGRAGILPKLNGEAKWDTTETDLGQTEGTRWSASLTQPFFDTQAWQDYKIGRARSDIASLNFESAKQELILRVAQSYFDALQAVDNLSTARAEQQALYQQLEQASKRFEVGLTAITEVHEARAAYDSATAEKLIEEGRLKIAFEALEVITGRPYISLSPLKENFPVVPPEPENREAWVEFSRENNLGLRTESLNEESARRTAKREKAGHYPTLEGFANYSDGNQTGDTTFEDNEITQYGVRLSVPIYNGGGVSASRRQAASNYLAAREIYNQTQRAVVQDARSTHLTVVTSVATVKARKQAIVSNQSALEATQAGYEVGTRDLVDVLNAQRNLYRAQCDYFTALYAYIINTLELKEVAGMLGDQDITALNAWLDSNKKVSPN